VLYRSLYKLLGFGTVGDVWEVIALEVRTDGWKIYHFFCENSDPISGVVELEAAFQLFFQFYWVYLTSSIIGGSLAPEVSDFSGVIRVVSNGQPPFQLTSRGETTSVRELHLLMAIEDHLLDP
jgi:hypothetical protein